MMCGCDYGCWCCCSCDGKCVECHSTSSDYDPVDEEFPYIEDKKEKENERTEES